MTYYLPTYLIQYIGALGKIRFIDEVELDNFYLVGFLEGGTKTGVKKAIICHANFKDCG